MFWIRSFTKLASHHRMTMTSGYSVKNWVSVVAVLCQVPQQVILTRNVFNPPTKCFINGCQPTACRESHDDHSVELNDDLTVDIEELSDIVENDTAYVIDVRSAKEIREVGQIPAKRWINIPLNRLEASLEMPEGKFKAKYGCSKPTTEDKMVFHCLSGVRSTLALNSALNHGFKNAKHYPGGWLGWMKHLHHHHHEN
ncbi:unnamed protein product [Clavelina lepadiformis]|uniref:Rhodanese domain-containing protein n=1 Tax=Clavelina lepadiformis TaxID=159417 RepID=A0ABP0GL69_CLALP